MATAASTSPFGKLETMVAQQSIRHLSNASATWWPGGQGVGAPVPGLRVIHDREQGAVRDAMVNDFNPVVTLLESDVPGFRRGDALNIVRDGEVGSGHLFSVERASCDGRGLIQADLSEGTL